MTDQQVHNTAFKTECIKAMSAIFSEASEMMCNENEMLRCASIIEREGHHLDKVKCAVPDWMREDA